MAFSRQLGVIGILGACFIVAVGCDDDGDKIASGGDAGGGGDDGGGTSGSGGRSTGGSNNNNNAGDGGTATAGSANEAGAAGDTVGGAGPMGGGAGEGGTAGAGGSVTGGAGAGAGAAGDAGSAGDGGGPAAAKSCSDECEVTADCYVADALTQKVCNQSNRCVEQFSKCEAHNDCVPWASGFLKKCLTQVDCDDVLAVCVDWQGSGYCATQPFEGLGCFGPPGLVESELTEFGDPDPSSVAVCINMEGRCDAGTCIVGCGATQECGGGNGDTCNEATGLCECATSAECDGKTCGADQHCAECVTAEDCNAEATGLDVCVDGVCGCSSATACLDQTAAGTPVCE